MNRKKSVSFFVPGVPASGGSKRGFVNVHTGRVNIVDTSKRAPAWKAEVKRVAERCRKGVFFGRDEALETCYRFVLPRPKSHYGTGKNGTTVKDKCKHVRPLKKPDVLKLARPTEDALTGVLWDDDVTTVRMTAEKAYGEAVGCLIIVRAL